MAPKELKTWNDIKKLDDVLSEKEKDIVKELEKIPGQRCHYLAKDGESFYFCGKDLDGKEEPIGPFNQKYQRHTDTASLQLFCMGEFDICYLRK